MNGETAKASIEKQRVIDSLINEFEKLKDRLAIITTNTKRMEKLIK